MMSEGRTQVDERLEDPSRTLRQRLVAAALSNPVNAAIVSRLDDLRVPDCWLMAGCVFQAVWNEACGRPPGSGVKDYDIAYFDATDTSYEAEDQVIRRARSLFADIDADIEIRNQARIHLWYENRFGLPYTPNQSSRDGIGRFLVTETCVALRQAASGIEVCAPYGLEGLFAGELSPNPYMWHPLRYAEKCASYRARWPHLRAEPARGESGYHE